MAFPFWSPTDLPQPLAMSRNFHEYVQLVIRTSTVQRFHPRHISSPETSFTFSDDCTLLGITDLSRIRACVPYGCVRMRVGLVHWS